MREVIKDRGRIEHMLDSPWLVIEKMRHVLVHGYYTVSPEKVWDTVQDDLPILKTQIEALLVEQLNHQRIAKTPSDTPFLSPILLPSEWSIIWVRYFKLT